MTPIVVDTSALLALFFAEPHGAWVGQQLTHHAGSLCMSTVNLTELFIRLRDRQLNRYQALEDEILTSGIRFVPPDVTQARGAAAARLRFPLNLGDCFAYALAQTEGGIPILTLDDDFRKLDVPVLMP